MQFIGLDTLYRNAHGEHKPRIHLDGAASPLASKVAVAAINTLLPHYSNVHSYVHNSASISTHALTWAHEQVLSFLGLGVALIGIGFFYNKVVFGKNLENPESNNRK